MTPLNRQVAQKDRGRFSTSVIKICGFPREGSGEREQEVALEAAEVTCPVLLKRRLPQEEEGKRAEEGMSAALRES